MSPRQLVLIGGGLVALLLLWGAAALVDSDCDETLQAIEFANLQLLEFRHIDNRLDDRLASAARLLHPPGRSWLPFWRSHARPLRVKGISGRGGAFPASR